LTCAPPVKECNILRGFERFEDNQPVSDNDVHLRSSEFLN
jgi:hypothetical protein